MLSSDGLHSTDVASSAAGDPAAASGPLHELFERVFGTPLGILDSASGEVLHAPEGLPACDWGLRAEVCREVARRGRPELIDEQDPFVLLAVPLSDQEGNALVGVAPFVTRRISPTEDPARAAESLGMPGEPSAEWARGQTPWSPEALVRLAELALSQWQSRQRAADLQHEAQALSVHLASTYEEISLLHRLTQNLRISESDEDLGRIALEWLAEVVPACGLALQLLPVVDGDAAVSHKARSQPVLLTYGECSLSADRLAALVEHLDPAAAQRPVVANRSVTCREGWPAADVRQVIAVALTEGENLFGWLAAVNHVEDAEFGSVEASLLSSVAAILGIHSGNLELYRQQSEIMAGIVRALTSAIDAKDPYTCGHSDRVARIAVRLAEQLGCERKILDTIYLSGLLHDIGKIGVEDQVLRKPDRLTDDEYEHIKKHVEVGHRILRDLGKLEGVLPVVRHHHESWDGRGYPDRLGLEGIPLSARIVAVADALDAMSSDRPYRKGMPDEKIDDIFRAGSGRQWDPQVVEALFSARDDVRAICRGEAEGAAVAPGAR